MNLKIQNFSRSFLGIDFILSNIAFFFMYYLKRETISLTSPYFKLLLAFYALNLVLSLLNKKYNLAGYKNYFTAFKIIIKTNIFILYGLAIMVVLLGLPGFSRLHIFGSCTILTVLEISLFTLYYFSGGKIRIQELYDFQLDATHYKNFSVYRLIADFFLLTFSFFLLNFYKRGSFELSTEYEKALYLIYALWLVTSLITRKFEKRPFRNFYYAFAPYVRSAVLMIATMAVLVFAFRLFFFSRLHIFGTFLLLLILETIFTWITYSRKIGYGDNGDIESVEEVQKVMQQEMLSIVEKNGKTHHGQPIQPIRDKLQERYLKGDSRLFEMLDKQVDLNQIDLLETMVLDTKTPMNIEFIDDNTLDLFINLHQVNDFRYLNRYFLEVHKKFFNGGFFVGKANTVITHRKKFFSKYPRPFAEIFYYTNFIYARIIPKMPGFKRLYFALTKGRGRVISKAELLGRLYFCGFKVLECQEIGDSLFYLAQKVRTPSFDRNPSYGPVIKLKRIGYAGEVMHVFKLRTMYPYSEYLQEYIYNHHKLQENGKFKDDFRLTEWGRIFRKFFIDELPQLVNYFRGDVNLVGVRALSDQYFNLYPKDAQQLRIQFKPGLVPPYYADMPNSLEEIVASEKQYLRAKENHPVTTDIRYFSKAVYNILFKKARSR
jgi:lipopolysaccharide/colanic/teichoic acid biosynthesis glycosyltransferase